LAGWLVAATEAPAGCPAGDRSSTTNLVTRTAATATSPSRANHRRTRRLGRAALDQLAQPTLKALQVGRLVPDPVDISTTVPCPNGRRPVPA
jgi:hypothetical protein